MADFAPLEFLKLNYTNPSTDGFLMQKKKKKKNKKIVQDFSKSTVYVCIAVISNRIISSFAIATFYKLEWIVQLRQQKRQS